MTDLEATLRAQNTVLEGMRSNMYAAARALTEAGIPEYGPTNEAGFAEVYSLEQRVRMLMDRCNKLASIAEISAVMLYNLRQMGVMTPDGLMYPHGLAERLRAMGYDNL